MRLHQLEVRAFGPFPGSEHVDFDTLSDAGLFLLCGPTGGGKTSVLDAVSFALFGQVPGERDKARRLRSDHAAEGVGPQVVLEVTLRARRMRITRSPEWTRPKKRGHGMTKEPAKVLLEEHQAGRWSLRTNRIDEAADLLGDLIGMTAGQFCQVALLPQGRFEAFLRSGSQERHALLERLFDAHRFRAIEEWLADRRTSLGRTCAEHETRIGTLVARAAEVGGQPPPVDDEGAPQLDDDIAGWSAAVRDALIDRMTLARTQRDDAHHVVKLARAELDAARVRGDLQARYADARARKERLDALADDTDEQARRVAAARRAEAVVPMIELHQEAQEHATRARTRLQSAFDAVDAVDAVLPSIVRARLAELLQLASPVDWPQDELADAARAARTDVARLTALLPTQAELDQVLDRCTATASALAEQVTLQEQAGAAVRQLDDRRATLLARLDELGSAGDDVTALQRELSTARSRVTSAAQVEEAEQRRSAAAAEVERATTAALGSREAWLDARQLRLDGMAAELAAGLTPGSTCPVCGSCEHPASAAPAAPVTTADQEQEAERRYREAEEVRARFDRSLRDSETVLAAASAAAAGLDLRAATQVRDETADALRRAEQAKRDRDATIDEQSRHDSELAEAARRASRIEAELATLREREQQLQTRRRRLEATLHAATGQAASLPDRLAQAAATEQSIAQLVEAVTQWRTASADQAARRRRLDQTLRVQGFADLTAAQRVLLPSTEISDLEALLARRAAEQRQVGDLLADPAVNDAAAAPRVDLESLEQQLAEREERRDEAVAAESELARQADRIERLHSELDAAVASWLPVQRAHRTAGSLATLCAGTSADNPERVRLSSYVLAARLSQVVDAANGRLERMTARRYLLEHCDARGVGDRRGGLGLRVRDGWTGESRDPATLSGGESFLASLALALGLADVVAHEAGGVELGTLFVDEGFGSLDAETLDEVMDVLDDLRSGGRVVGLVSHVAELRARVGTQVRITRTRAGSSLAQV